MPLTRFISAIILLAGLVGNPFVVLAITVDVSARVVGCGDNTIDVGEQCDGSNLGGSSCTLQGFTGGSLSCASSCTFNTSACTAGGGGTSGGGGGTSNPTPSTNVVFSGKAYPLSRVSILKDGQLAVTTIAGLDGSFTATISGLSTGNYTFIVYGEDKNNIRSSPFTFPIYLTSDATTKIGGIFISPTIAVDKSEVKRGDTITIFGQAAATADVTISIHSGQEFVVKKKTDENGLYLVYFDSSVLEIGDHSAKSKSTKQDEVSTYGKAVGFKVGDKNVFVINEDMTLKGDLNYDKRVNLIDFSIAAFWYKKKLDSKFIPKEAKSLNGDGKVDLIDFSIISYNWTG